MIENEIKNKVLKSFGRQMHYPVTNENFALTPDVTNENQRGNK